MRILTGDAPAVAAKVARTLGILPSESVPPCSGDVTLPIETGSNEKDWLLTGSQLAALSEDKTAYHEAVERCLIFAKLSPHQKLEVVQALRKNGGGRAVAFLGDGVNDALAIRAADVGISVDSGTEIAKEAADVILLEKSLGVIAHGVLQGRITYGSWSLSFSLRELTILFFFFSFRFINTVKYIKMACSSNFGNVFSVLGGFLFFIYFLFYIYKLTYRSCFCLVAVRTDVTTPTFIPKFVVRLFSSIHPLVGSFFVSSLTGIVDDWGTYRDNVDPEYLKVPMTWRAKSILRFMLFLGPTSSIFDICIFSLNWQVFGYFLSVSLAHVYIGSDMGSEMLILLMCRERKRHGSSKGR